MARPPATARSLPSFTKVRIKTIRSPFLPEILAQSSGLVVFGRSSCSRNSCRIESKRSWVQTPRLPPEMTRLIASFFDRLTIFSIIAPDEKSRKYITSLSPFAYVTSRNRLISSSLYILSTADEIMFTTADSGDPCCATSDSAIGISVVKYRPKICVAAISDGRSILILTSSRPGRKIAGSIRSSRLVAPITITLRRPSTPSISANNWGTIVDSISEEIPVPRVRNIESISSKKTMTGQPSSLFSRAR